MLNKIIANKKEEIRGERQSIPLSLLKEKAAKREAPLDFALAISGKHTKLIAEVKRASPSRGIFCSDFNPAALAHIYAQSGCAAISVLTDNKYFHGSINHLAEIRKKVKLPLLRKDFILDPYQVYQSRVYGADALLLIVAILSQKQLEKLLILSHDLGLKCLVEVHSEDEVERAILSGAEIIGINNRNLNTFTTDIDNTRRLLPLIPTGHIVVSESGISNRNDVAKLKEWGVNAILVGEALVTATDIGSKIRELIL